MEVFYTIKLGKKMIKAILFDADGVLIDATQLHYESFNRALKEVTGHEISKQDHETIYNGLPTKVKLDILVKAGTVRLSDISKIWQLKQDYTKEVIKEHLTFDPVKVEMHQYIKSLGLKIACVTNSIRETATLMLATTGQLEYMDLLVCNEDTARNKPFPDPYLFAMEKLGVKKEEVAICEDSEKGYQSALASGANHLIKVNGYEDVTKQLIEMSLKNGN